MSSIAVVDFESINLKRRDSEIDASDFVRVGGDLCKTFAETGFAYAKNFGIDKADIDKVRNVCDTFFDLPSNVKSKYARNNFNFGYVGLEVESLNPERPGDLKECFNVNGFGLTNNTAKWPNVEVDNFEQSMRAFLLKCAALSRRILSSLSQGLHLKDSNFLLENHQHLCEECNQTTMRYLRYRPIISEVKPNQIRLGEHSDYGSFTLLFQDNVGGLQAESIDGEFCDVNPLDDAMVLNIGDILQFWTEGRLKSTKHRVLIPKNESRKAYRRSLAYFVHPDDGTLLLPMKYKPLVPWPKKFAINCEDATLNAREYAFKLFNKTY